MYICIYVYTVPSTPLERMKTALFFIHFAWVMFANTCFKFQRSSGRNHS